MPQAEKPATTGALADIIAANGGTIPSPDEAIARAKEQAEIDRFHETVRSIDDLGDYRDEADDPNVLIYGPWLERGGSAFWVSTAGTGKSIASIQLAHAMSAGLPFCGLRPRRPLKFWVFQSEDSPRRVAQDRIDVRAELADLHPEVDWQTVGRTIKFPRLDGAVGVAFLASLDHLLAFAEKQGEKPDVIILNPLLAFVGGPISDGAYVTPFLRGGEIGHSPTCGLQSILERHGVAVLVFHHTPKPPTEKELDGWMKSQFPEYQGAGSSDITNWGRSFVTMMRVKNHPSMVCVTAGKNGAELGWERIGGPYRRYIAYSNEPGQSGKGRHAWRELSQEEYDEIVGAAKSDDEKKINDAVAAIVTAIKTAAVAPMASTNGLSKFMEGKGIPRNTLRAAIPIVLANAEKHRLTVKGIIHPNNKWEDHIGLAENLRAAEHEQEQLRRLKAARQGLAEPPPPPPPPPPPKPTQPPPPPPSPAASAPSDAPTTPTEEDDGFYEF